jgi:hypothetical protein
LRVRNTCKSAPIVSAVSSSVHLKNCILDVGSFTELYQSIHILFKVTGTLPAPHKHFCSNLGFHWLVIHQVFFDSKNFSNSSTEKYNTHSLSDSIFLYYWMVFSHYKDFIFGTGKVEKFAHIFNHRSCW